MPALPILRAYSQLTRPVTFGRWPGIGGVKERTSISTASRPICRPRVFTKKATAHGINPQAQPFIGHAHHGPLAMAHVLWPRIDPAAVPLSPSSPQAGSGHGGPKQRLLGVGGESAR